MPEAAGPSSVSEIVDSLGDAATGEKTSLREAIESLGEASFVPVLMAPALAVVTPLSGIPLFSSICGALIALVSIQMLLNRDHLWLPDWLMKRRIPSDKLRDATEKMEKPAAFLDRYSRKRLSLLVRRPARWVTETACLICGSLMPLLELVPFSSSLLGSAVVLFALGLLVRDGLFCLLAFLFLGAVGTTGYFVFM
ncbi:exopolysaccharide synthesis protein [Phaeobacter sp. 22II1-1F12B]|nr:exopolysaccharide synthesis protein [Phaeobacter sp. 22II1-1F12B]